jgi:serine/threonine-protein kinase
LRRRGLLRFSEVVTTDRSAAGSDPNALVGTILAERYRIEELLGQGGMGTVYRAEHIHMRRTVAFKVLHPEVAAVTEIAARFEREAIAVGRVEHRNVAKAMDFGRLPDGSFYLVVEYVKGESLSEVIKRGPLAPQKALEIARQIADAIKAAHEAGVVHRDLKPDNVMITDRDGVKVLDFGVAKLTTDHANTGSAITQYGAILGTFTYMAPEQAGGGAVDHRADLYGLGVILYELLAGRPPFSSDEPLVMLSKHLTEPPPPLPPSIPEKTTAVVFDLLAKDPASRIQTAADLIARIDEAHAALGQVAVESRPEPAISADNPSEKPPPSAPPRRRRPSVALAIGALVSLAMIAGALTLAMAERGSHSSSSGVGESASAAAANLNAGGLDLATANAKETIGQGAPKATDELPKATNEVPSATAEATTAPDEAAKGTDEPPETSGEAVPIQAPAYGAAVPPSPNSRVAGQTTTGESGETTATATEGASSPAPRTARQGSPKKKISAPRRGRKYVIRRTIVRRTITTRR